MLKIIQPKVSGGNDDKMCESIDCASQGLIYARGQWSRGGAVVTGDKGCEGVEWSGCVVITDDNEIWLG